MQLVNEVGLKLGQVVPSDVARLKRKQAMAHRLFTGRL